MRALKFLLVLLAGLALSGCGALPREAFSARDIQGGAPQGLTDLRFDATDAAAGLHFADAARTRAAGQKTFDVLAVSGGGSNGAFGAGVLVGWTKAGDRPEFDIVTGVSTGALTAPFAFLGPDWDKRLTEAYTSDAAERILDRRGFDILFRPSFYSGAALRALVERYVDPPLLYAVAVEHTRGRRLLIATTNLDTEQTVIWDMGAIAARGDGAHVPDHCLLGVEIGGGDQQAPASSVFDGDGIEQGRIDISLDQRAQGRAAVETGPEQDVEAAPVKDPLGRIAGIGLGQALVPVRAEEGEGGGQGTGRDSGDDVELGPVAGLRPAHQNAGSEGAVRAAAGDGQHIEGLLPGGAGAGGVSEMKARCSVCRVEAQVCQALRRAALDIACAERLTGQGTAAAQRQAGQQNEQELEGAHEPDREKEAAST